MMTSGDYAGELTAVCTLVCWAFGSQCFEAAGKRIGSMAVNLLRLILAFFMFCVVLWLRNAQLVPLDFSADAWAWLLLTG